MALSAAHKAIVAEYTAQRPLYEEFVEALREWVAELCLSEEIAPARIEARAKSVTSLVGKFARYPDLSELTEFPDLAGIRVIVFRPDEVDQVRELFYREFEIAEQEYHGGESVETFGYRGLHLSVQLNHERRSLPAWRAFKDLQAEVQIHTVLQNAWSAISHDLDYKAKEHVPADARRALFRLAALLESCDELLAEFCREAEGLRTRYRREIEGGSWADVPLDVESIQLGWDSLASVTEGLLGEGEAREGKGFRRDPPDPAALARLLDLAELCGVRTLAGLHEVVAETQPATEEVRNVLAEGDPDRAPTIDDVIGVALLLNQPSLHDDAHVWLGRELAEALVHLPGRRQGPPRPV